MYKKLAILTLIALACLGWAGATEIPSNPDAESTVPELFAFHDVIYPIWHQAYPDKDYAALAGFVPDINAGAEKIYAAKLPGILRDKETAWKNGLDELRKAVAAYNLAVQEKNNEALLLAAETLHSRFEMLVRIIRPVLKQVDAFHKVLYVVYHTYLPNKQYDQIGAVSGDLTAKAEAIAAAKLPERLQDRTARFNTASKQLVKLTKSLAKACRKNDPHRIETAVEKMHSGYQAVEKVFE